MLVGSHRHPFPLQTSDFTFQTFSQVYAPFYLAPSSWHQPFPLKKKFAPTQPSVPQRIIPPIPKPRLPQPAPIMPFPRTFPCRVYGGPHTMKRHPAPHPSHSSRPSHAVPCRAISPIPVPCPTNSALLHHLCPLRPLLSTIFSPEPCATHHPSPQTWSVHFLNQHAPNNLPKTSPLAKRSISAIKWSKTATSHAKYGPKTSKRPPNWSPFRVNEPRPISRNLRIVRIAKPVSSTHLWRGPSSFCHRNGMKPGAGIHCQRLRSSLHRGEQGDS
jgi:hypothetical protein